MNRKALDIAIVDDHRSWASLLAKDLIQTSENHICVLFTATHGKEMQERILLHGAPKVMFMDLQMDGMDGYHNTLWLRNHHPDVRVLAMSAFDNHAAVLEMLACGARGFVSKNGDAASIYAALVDLRENGVHLNEFVTEDVWQRVHLRSQNGYTALTPWLNEHRMAFLQLYCQDIKLSVIADKLCRSEHTIKHMGDEMQAHFRVHSRHAVIHKAHEMGLVNLLNEFY
ncbi:DNA-binding response regulator, NarL/FixJ family, contains REC and HTH domains [bacterium A37T11]|nr:DNA-binding response regulator, NarL/FixJ family, contains REC and HTH domains [bacterium A37T11]